MKRALTFSVLLAFTWLQTYQFCDASEDVLESIPASVPTPTLVEASVCLNAPAVSADDPDDLIPSVYDGTLEPDSVVFIAPAEPSILWRTGPAIVSPPRRILSNRNGPSPPGPVFLLVASLQSLAPPTI